MVGADARLPPTHLRKGCAAFGSAVAVSDEERFDNEVMSKLLRVIRRQSQPEALLRFDFLAKNDDIPPLRLRVDSSLELVQFFGGRQRHRRILRYGRLRDGRRPPSDG